MRFSGHETFSVREGWLHKGLRLLIKEPEKMYDEFTADYLGVGSNMAKSIRHWLQATKLAVQDSENRGRIKPTPFGELVFEKDPYFVETGTWWLLHINLIAHKSYADTWNWFFNYFNLENFDRPVVVENLRQYIQLKNKKVPSLQTLDRDVACLLSSYARHIPNENIDPEGVRDCPFRELGLMSYFRTSGTYQMHFRAKEIHPSIFGYCIAELFNNDVPIDIDIQQLVREPSGPGRTFVLTSESLFETLNYVMSENDEIKMHGHAGKRAVSLPNRNSLDWISKYFEEIRKVKN